MVKKDEKEQFESAEELDDFMAESPIEDDHEAFEEAEDEKEALDSTKAEEESDIPIPEFEEEDNREEDMLDIAADVPIQVVAVLGKRNISVKEIAALKMGEVVDLNRPANEIVDLVAGGKLIAKGELVEIEGKLGVRIVKMLR
jgi:flagellar motor switch protein FliM